MIIDRVAPTVTDRKQSKDAGTADVGALPEVAARNRLGT